MGGRGVGRVMVYLEGDWWVSTTTYYANRLVFLLRFFFIN